MSGHPQYQSLLRLSPGNTIDEMKSHQKCITVSEGINNTDQSTADMTWASKKVTHQYKRGLLGFF